MRLPMYLPRGSLSLLLRSRQYGQLASLQVPHCNLAMRILPLDQFCSPHRSEHCVSAGLDLAIKKDLEFSPSYSRQLGN